MWDNIPDHVYTPAELADKLRAVWEELIYCRTAADQAGFDDVGEAIGRAGDPIEDAQVLLSLKEV